ncbi:Uncharacterized protein DBV15_03170 [Temnothorax longispinosus]|uniref:Uncharacterized protein n=1 Tax=Temnothorax longispinosus TaxID=300112 RepID=A0A4S2KN96_9HYME|nr:Uncharacterized protein DBV15_03170 [Temnothorax longispinosus]
MSNDESLSLLRYYVHFTYRARSIIAGYRQDTDSLHIDLGGSIHVRVDTSTLHVCIVSSLSTSVPPSHPLTQPCRPPTFPFIPLRALPTAHTLLAPPYGSVAASRPVASPSVSFKPIPSTGTKAENEEGRKRLRWGIRRNEEARASYRARWCPYPHHTARRTDLDPPTRLAEGKPSRKNRPPFRGRKRTTATTLPLPPPPPPLPSPSPPLDSAASFERFSRHRATTTSVILSLPPAPPALYPSPPPTTPRSTVISRNVGYNGNLQTANHACSSASEERTCAKSGDAIEATDGGSATVLIALGERETNSSPIDNRVKVNPKIINKRTVEFSH